jgi:hypothetical protein
MAHVSSSLDEASPQVREGVVLAYTSGDGGPSSIPFPRQHVEGTNDRLSHLQGPPAEAQSETCVTYLRAALKDFNIAVTANTIEFESEWSHI